MSTSGATIDLREHDNSSGDANTPMRSPAPATKLRDDLVGLLVAASSSSGWFSVSTATALSIAARSEISGLPHRSSQRGIAAVASEPTIQHPMPEHYWPA
jgi:hypothetical protein